MAFLFLIEVRNPLGTVFRIIASKKLVTLLPEGVLLFLPIERLMPRRLSARLAAILESQESSRLFLSAAACVVRGEIAGCEG